MSAPVSERTTLHRYAHRADYSRETVDAILDEGIVCHVGLQTDRGYPVVIPLAYGRVGDTIYLHGSAASRLFRGARKDGIEICMTVTFVDGLVVARSTYNTDINYRSVMIIGSAARGEGSGREADRARCHGRPHHPRTEPRRSASDRERAAEHNAAQASHRRIVGQGAHRMAARRGGGLRLPGLGRGHPVLLAGRSTTNRSATAIQAGTTGLRVRVPRGP